MKPVAWRIFRGGRWSYSEIPGGSIQDRAAWQPLYAENFVTHEPDLSAEREACANVCEEYDRDGKVSNIGLFLANRIRQRTK